MIDQELLQLAAKAAKYETDLSYEHDEDWGLKIVGLKEWWNPLTDDGDALRLAIKLEINLVHHHHGIGWVDAFRLGSVTIKELIGDDAAKATRLAIVKLAASIGKTK